MDSVQRIKDKGDRPVIWLGYFTARPYSPNYKKMIQAGWKDAAPNEWDRYCLYIFYNNIKLQRFSRRSAGTVSDTEIQMAHFEIPKKLAATEAASTA